jgi:hypothetical protein
LKGKGDIYTIPHIDASKKKGTYMRECGERMLDGRKPPGTKGVSKWVGAANFKRWMRIINFIEANYPGVFEPDWQFGGEKHGWGLRFKRSKCLCTLIPERGRVMIQIVFGAEEREKAEEILPKLVSHTSDDYKEATTYHDGKWLFLEVDSNKVIADVERLLAIKRKPKLKHA